MAALDKDIVENIPQDISFLYHPDHWYNSKKARHRGLNYYLQGYIHDIQLNTQDGTLNVRSSAIEVTRRMRPHTLDTLRSTYILLRHTAAV